MPIERRRRTIAGDGVDLALWEAGPEGAPTVVLIHGYPDTHHVWDGVVDLLAEDHHVVAYDVRGAGESGTPADRVGYDLSFLVGDLRAVIEATSPDRPVHLVGHDWGSVQGWEAATCGLLDGRIATWTSLSGPCLDHIGAWMADRRDRARHGDRVARTELLAQARRSWYIAAFRLPLLAPLAWRTVAPRGFRRVLAEVEGIEPTPTHPASTLADDGRNGLELYRRNVGERLARPRERRTDVPTQLLVALQDAYVTPASLGDVGDHCADLVRHEVEAGHWVPVTDPTWVAGRVGEHVARHEGVRSPAPTVD